MTAVDITEAHVELDPEDHQPRIEIQLTPEGQLRFAALTRATVHRPVALLLNDRILSTPVVMQEIRGGTMRLTTTELAPSAGRMAAARQLAAAFSAGPLTAHWQIASIHR